MMHPIVNYFFKNSIIIALLILKLLTQHITGCLLASYSANERVKLFDRRSISGRRSTQMEAVMIILALGFNQYLLHRVIMAEDGGANVLVLQPVGGIYSANFFTILWLIIVSQFFVNLVEISLKATLSLLSIPFNRRGYSYSLIKNLLTLYRWILPMPQICAYLWSSSQSSVIPQEDSEETSSHTHGLISSIFDIILIV